MKQQYFLYTHQNYPPNNIHNSIQKENQFTNMDTQMVFAQEDEPTDQESKVVLNPVRQPSTRKSRQERKQQSQIKNRRNQQQEDVSKQQISSQSKRAKDRARLNTYSDISSHLQEHNFNNCATKKYDLSEDQVNKSQKSNNLNSPDKTPSGYERGSNNKPNIQDFIIDFEAINQEMMQNQFDKANIMGYSSNKFFSNPANNPTNLSSSKVDTNTDNDVSKDSFNQSTEYKKDNNGSLAKYFQKKAVNKNKQHTLSVNINKSEQKKMEDKMLAIQEDTDEPSSGMKNIKEMQKEKDKQLKQSKSLNKMLGWGQSSFTASAYIQQENEPPQFKQSREAQKMAISKSFMNKTVNLKDKQKMMYQSQFKQKTPQKDMPSFTKKKVQNASINSRFLNGRPDNNFGKDLPNIQNVNESREISNGSDFEQVSMGSLGAAEGEGIQDLRFDNVMRDTAEPVEGPKKQKQFKQITKIEHHKNFSTIQPKNDLSSINLNNHPQTFKEDPKKKNIISPQTQQKKMAINRLKTQNAKDKPNYVPSISLFSQHLSNDQSQQTFLNKKQQRSSLLTGNNLPFSAFSPRTPKMDITSKKPQLNINTLKKMTTTQKNAVSTTNAAYIAGRKRTLKQEEQPSMNRSKTLVFNDIQSITEEPNEPEQSNANDLSINNQYRSNQQVQNSLLQTAISKQKLTARGHQVNRNKRLSINQNTQSESILKPLVSTNSLNPKNSVYKIGQHNIHQVNKDTQQPKRSAKKSIKSHRGSNQNLLFSTQNISSKNFKIAGGILADKQQLNQPQGSVQRDRMKNYYLTNQKPQTQKSFLKTTRNTISMSLNKKEKAQLINSNSTNILNSLKHTLQQPVLSGKTSKRGLTHQNKDVINQPPTYRELLSKRHTMQQNQNHIREVKTMLKSLIHKNTGETQQKKEVSKKKLMTQSKTRDEHSFNKSIDRGFQNELKDLKNITADKIQAPTSKIDLTTTQIKQDEIKIIDEVEKEYPNKSFQMKKSIDDVVKTVAIIVNKGQPKTTIKSSANPQGPSSSLSGQKLQSKSVLTQSSRKQQTSVSPDNIEKVEEEEEIKYPLTYDLAVKHFKDSLNDYELQEMQSFNNEIYYVGQNCKAKKKGHVIKMVQQETPQQFQSRRASGFKKNSITVMIPSERQTERLKQMNIFNYGYDDDQGDYKTVMLDHIGYRFEVLEHLGSGSFGQAVQCLDHKTGETLAIKIIRNKKKFQYQAGMELKILKYLNRHDQHDQNNIIRVKDYQVFREHLIIAFELLSINLYEFIRNNNFQGVSQNLIRRFSIQILQALKYQQDHNLVHCDLKPENILLKQQNKSGIKIIDYGSSCFMGQRIYTYIQSRFYRAPEIILGIPYTTAIDMWSFGAIIAELYTGFPLFPGESEVEQLAYIMELYDVPARDVLKISQRRHLFFDKNDEPILQPNSRGKVRQPGAKKLEDILNCQDDSFLDFMNKCFKWHPVDRMTPLEALQHPWILEGLPEKVLKHHKKMFGQTEKKKMLKEMTFAEIQGFPKDKKDLTIQEIVDEIRLEDKKRETRDMLQKKKQSLSQNSNKEHEKVKQLYKSARQNSLQASKKSMDIQQSNKLLKLQTLIDNPVGQTQRGSKSKFEKINIEQIQSTNQTQPSPNKERKTRKQRKENQEIKNILTDFSQNQIQPNIEKKFHLSDIQERDEAPQPESQVLMQQDFYPKPSEIIDGKLLSKIKVYIPENEEQKVQKKKHSYLPDSLPQQYLTQKTPEDFSVSQVRDEFDEEESKSSGVKPQILISDQSPKKNQTNRKPKYQQFKVQPLDMLRDRLGDEKSSASKNSNADRPQHIKSESFNQQEVSFNSKFNQQPKNNKGLNYYVKQQKE